MKKQVCKLMVILMFGLFAGTAWSSNIQIFETPTIEEDPANTGKKKLIKFGLSWDYSWRTVDPNNWDAAWVFVKYRIGSEAWDHMYLDDTFIPEVGQDNDVAMTHKYGYTNGRTLGVFLYRKNNGRGHIKWEDVTLRWQYDEVDGYVTNSTTSSTVKESDQVTIRVFAIEMVYVPTGAFYLGSGGIGTGEFCRADRPSTVNEPYLVENEAAISVRARQGLAQFEDINGVIGVGTAASIPRPGGLSTMSNTFTGNPSTAAPAASSIGILGEGENGIPTLFPKGYQGFYCMKYEITQGAYVDFLNTLTVIQQAQRIRLPQTPTSPANTRVMIQNDANDRNWIKIMKSGVAEFGCDMNNNGILDEDDDGQNVACAININDLMAYLDFSGLRPMTELEFEKACRGTRDPVPNEFAWGSTYFNSSALSWAAGTDRRPNERPSTVGANHIGNGAQAWVTRNGAFANDSSGRVVSGATYYGIMEMSTNLREITVNIINASGRAYTGEHGDGRLTDGGSQNVTGWPDYFGFGWRGGYTIAIGHGSEHMVSDRRTAWWNSVPTNTTNAGGNSWALGGRGVRTIED